jgi:hypothetical protein
MMYGLDASRAKMQMTNTSYHIDFDGLIFKANFSEADDPLWINARDFPLFKPYEVIMNLTWFAKRRIVEILMRKSEKIAKSPKKRGKV